MWKRQKECKSQRGQRSPRNQGLLNIAGLTMYEHTDIETTFTGPAKCIPDGTLELKEVDIRPHP